MVIYYGNSIEGILKKNKDLEENEPIIGVGVDVVTKPLNSDRPFFYKAKIRYLYKSDLDSFVADDVVKKDEILNRHIIATRAFINMSMTEVQEELEKSSLLSVLENDWYIKKLINEDIIQEVQGFIFDPQEKLKEKGFNQAT